ncbi:MAG: NuoI/complex I 23 kDa subunit family protein [bacterium]
MPDEPVTPTESGSKKPGLFNRMGHAIVGFLKSFARFILNLLLDIWHVIVAIFLGVFNLVRKVWRAFGIAHALVKGHLITLKYFFKPKVTVQYPFQRSKVAPYYRGRHYIVVDEDTGKIRCDGCTLCAKICPTSVIDVIGIGKGENKIPKHFTLNLVACVFCGLCVDVCPEDAIKMAREFELASPWRPDAYEHRGDRPLVLNLDDMLIYESAIYPDGRARNKHFEEDIAKHVRLEKERAARKGGTGPAQS